MGRLDHQRLAFRMKRRLSFAGWGKSDGLGASRSSSSARDIDQVGEDPYLRDTCTSILSSIFVIAAAMAASKAGTIKNTSARLSASCTVADWLASQLTIISAVSLMGGLPRRPTLALWPRGISSDKLNPTRSQLRGPKTGIGGTFRFDMPAEPGLHPSDGAGARRAVRACA